MGTPWRTVGVICIVMVGAGTITSCASEWSTALANVLRDPAEGVPLSATAQRVAIISDPFDWIAFWTLIATIFASRAWEIADRRRARKQVKRAELKESQLALTNARSIAQMAHWQVLFASRTAQSLPLAPQVGSSSNFMQRWSIWIRDRVDGVIEALQALDDRLVGVANLGTARLTLISRLRWLAREGGAVAATGDPGRFREYFVAAEEDTLHALRRFHEEELRAIADLRAAGGTPEVAVPYDEAGPDLEFRSDT